MHRNQTPAPQVGEIRQFNFQADVYGGRYRLVKHLGGTSWEAEHVEPSDEEIDAIMNDPSEYAGGGVYIMPDGSAVFPKGREETALARIDQTGARFNIRIVSAAEFSRHF